MAKQTNSNKPEKIVARFDAVIGKRRVEAVVKDHFPIADTIPEVLRLIGNIHNRINHCIVKRQIVLTCETQEICNVDVHANVVLRIIHPVKEVEMLFALPIIDINVFHLIDYLKIKDSYYL